LAIWDAAGVDTIVATNDANITKGNGSGLFSVIDLREGAGSQIGFLSETWAEPYYSQDPNGFGWRSAWPNIYIAYGAVVENVVGSNGKDMITGNGVNNKITGGSGDDVINGGAEVDTAVFSGNRGQYTLSKTADGYLLQDTISNRDGADTLASIERLQFTNNRVALDLAPTDSAGQAVLFIGVLAPNLVASPGTVGLILNYVDGGLSMQQLNQLAVDSGLVHNLAGGNSNANVARLAFKNVEGVPAAPDMIDLLVGFMDGRSANFTQSEFLTAVANLEANQVNVDLVGLAQTGIEYAFG
ncbi:MAG TPA: hypothetical protein VFY78_12830, partial [Gammaproteobacteria bacterium]|nr:hypothetical protein [Gammaproteobacteria bacterium]